MSAVRLPVGNGGIDPPNTGVPANPPVVLAPHVVSIFHVPPDPMHCVLNLWSKVADQLRVAVPLKGTLKGVASKVTTGAGGGGCTGTLTDATFPFPMLFSHWILKFVDSVRLVTVLLPLPNTGTTDPVHWLFAGSAHTSHEVIGSTDGSFVM